MPWANQQEDGESGLIQAVINSTVTPEVAADGLLAYIKKYVPEKRIALLAGNSVHADRAFLRKEPYKKVLDHLHYRILDVSSIKEATRRWRYVHKSAYRSLQNNMLIFELLIG